MIDASRYGSTPRFAASALDRLPVIEREEDLPEAVGDVRAAVADEVAEAALQHAVRLERLARLDVEIGELERSRGFRDARRRRASSRAWRRA